VKSIYPSDSFKLKRRRRILSDRNHLSTKINNSNKINNSSTANPIGYKFKTTKRKYNSCLKNCSDNRGFNPLIQYKSYDSCKLNRELLLKLKIIVNPKILKYFQSRNYKICYNFKLDKSNEIAKTYEKKIKLENSQIRKIKFVTLKDYDILNPCELLSYDKRSFFRLLWDIAITEHPLLNLIFFKSLLDPLWVRFIVFIFELKVSLAMSALFFSDDYIDARSEVPEEMRVK
jgi:hypothetical protein